MLRGRKAEEDTTPGKVLGLAILANVPIAFAFVVSPLLTGDVVQARSLAPFVLWGVPPVVALSVWFFVRAPADRKLHRAARIGVVLDAVAALLWLLVLLAPR